MRYKDAKLTFQETVARKIDGDFAHTNMYVVAFLMGDAAEMQRQLVAQYL
ncbi:MAG TPA: hypothetical protein VJN21_06930 [Candidatus Acidoferrales bacterium]|nr:hypothetical protein [Candidatus Acidoferrales bacterium]